MTQQVDTREVTRLRFGAKVMTPIGPGYLDAWILDDNGQPTGRALISHARSDFEPEKWLTLNPHNGPGLFKQYGPEELTPVATPFPVKGMVRGKAASWGEVVSNAEKAMKDKPQKLNMGAGQAAKVIANLDSVTVGSKWKTNKKGDRYVITDINVTGQCTLSWLDGKYTRVIEKAAVLKSYSPIKEDEDGTDGGGEDGAG